MKSEDYIDALAECYRVRNAIEELGGSEELLEKVNDRIKELLRLMMEAEQS